MPHPAHAERHFTQRIGWLRAAVLGANDGIVSTAALVAGVAGLVAGAMSMAAGEYVSVSSQSDTERVDLARERRELQGIYEARGLDPELARRVTEQLTARDVLAAHARDELGITEAHVARPTQAALASAATFAVGAALPLGVAALVPLRAMIPAVAASSLACLAGLGAVAAHAGGAGRVRGAVRVTIWGALALALTALGGRLFATTV